MEVIDDDEKMARALGRRGADADGETCGGGVQSGRIKTEEDRTMTLLINGTFEGIDRPGEWTRDTYTGVAYGEIYVPAGWVAFWEEGIYRRPEAKVIPRQAPFLDPARIHQGDWSVQMFTYYGQMHAGLYQVVAELTPGATYEFSIQAHAWSTTPGLEGEHDAHCSAGVGCGPVYILPEDVPPLNGDPSNDALGNFVFQVGISSGDEPDPFSDVNWCSGACIYNAYHKVPPIRFTAPQGGTVVVYVKATSLWRFRNSDIYLDDAKLIAIDEPPSPDRGKPRVQYERTYVLLPPDADQEWAHAVIEATWDQRRYTVGGSADDSGIGDLDYRRAIAVNPLGWGDGLELFFEDHYAGVEYLPIYAETPEVLRQILSGEDSDIALSQNDPRWADEDLGEDPGGETIGQGGCLLVGFAICLRHAGHWICPDELNDILAEAGTPFTSDDLLTDWPAAVGLFDVFDDSRKTNVHLGDAALESLLVSGWEIILRRADGKHFVYLESVAGITLHIIDPWDGKRKLKDASAYLGIRAAHRTDATPPLPPPVGNPIGLHLQSMSFGWEDYVRDAKPNVTKVLASMHDVAGVKRIQPDALVVWRHVDNCYDGIIDNPDPHEGARIWIAKFRPSLYDRCEELAQIPGITKPYFYVEPVNEVYPSHNAAGVTRAVNLDIAHIEEVDALDLPLKAVVFTAGIGNPHESEYELLLPLARKAEEYSALMGYHGYFWVDHGVSHLESDWQWHAGRWMEMDKVFVQHGIHVKWFGAEGGAHFDASSGWRAANCLNGDWEAYLALLLQWKAKIDEWNAENGNRYLGQVLFTTGGHGWSSWEFQESEMRALAQAL